MEGDNLCTFEDFLASQMKDPNFKKEYDKVAYGEDIFYLIQGHWINGKMEQEIYAFYVDENDAFDSASARAFELEKDWKPENPDQFIWIANDYFDIDELYSPGILCLGIGSESRDVIVEYYTLKLIKEVKKEVAYDI